MKKLCGENQYNFVCGEIQCKIEKRCRPKLPPKQVPGLGCPQAGHFEKLGEVQRVHF